MEVLMKPMAQKMIIGQVEDEEPQVHVRTDR